MAPWTWDEIIPHDLKFKFHHWVDDIDTIKIFELNKFCVHGQSLVSVDHDNLEVHAFWDASGRDYGGVVYVDVMVNVMFHLL